MVFEVCARIWSGYQGKSQQLPQRRSEFRQPNRCEKQLCPGCRYPTDKTSIFVAVFDAGGITAMSHRFHGVTPTIFKKSRAAFTWYGLASLFGCGRPNWPEPISTRQWNAPNQVHHLATKNVGLFVTLKTTVIAFVSQNAHGSTHAFSRKIMADMTAPLSVTRRSYRNIRCHRKALYEISNTLPKRSAIDLLMTLVPLSKPDVCWETYHSGKQILRQIY